MTKPINMGRIIERFRESWLTLTDVRKGNNSQKYTMVDGALAALSVFLTQLSSFLAFQRDIEQKKQNSNARTLFKMEQIPRRSCPAGKGWARSRLIKRVVWTVAIMNSAPIVLPAGFRYVLAAMCFPSSGASCTSLMPKPAIPSSTMLGSPIIRFLLTMLLRFPAWAVPVGKSKTRTSLCSRIKVITRNITLVMAHSISPIQYSSSICWLFLFTRLLHIANHDYRLLRETLAVRCTFFHDFRALTRYLLFDSWQHLFYFMIDGLEIQHSLP
jgi:hypothetical protein